MLLCGLTPGVFEPDRMCSFRAMIVVA